MPLVDTSQPPFDRGQTYSAIVNGAVLSYPISSEPGGTPTGQVGTEYPGDEVLALERWFPDLDYASRGKPRRSGGHVLCRAVRNMTSGSLLPKRLVYTGNSLGTAVAAKSYTALGGSKELGRVYGYTDSLNAVGYPVDEFLPVAGVITNDVFWIVIRGNATVLCDVTALAAIAIGDMVVAQTAASSTAAGSTGVGGRISGSTGINTASGTNVAASQVFGIIGRALSAATTNQTTNFGILVHVTRWD